MGDPEKPFDSLLSSSVEKGQNWLFWSTRRSIEHDVPSVSAILETLIAVPIFWWLAGKTGFYLPLIISMVVAPFVLLRSDRSVDLGLRWFLAWHKRKGTGTVAGLFDENAVQDEKAIGTNLEEQQAPFEHAHHVAHAPTSMPLDQLAIRLSITLASGVAAGVAVAWELTPTLKLIQAPTWFSPIIAVWLSLFVQIVTDGAIRSGATLIMRNLSAIWQPRQTRLLNFVVQGMLSGLVIQALLATISLGGLMIWILLVWVTLTLMSARYVIYTPYYIRSWFRVILNVVYVISLLTDILLASSSAIYLFSETMLIRMAATVVHWRDGLASLPRNFRRLVICTSPAQLPDLIPGLAPGSNALQWFTLPDVLRSVANIRRYFPIAVLIPTIIHATVIFLPAWLYRITLKSTAWFWWPLTLLGGEARFARDPELFHERALKTLWGITGIVSCLATIAAFLFTNLVLTGGLFQQNPLLNALGYALLIDWSGPPWQLLSVFSATLSLFVIFRLDYVLREFRYATRHERADVLAGTTRKFFVIELASRLRLICTLAFWSLVGCHTFLYLNSLGCWVRIPSSLEAPGRILYGKRLPPLSCVQSNTENM